MLSGLSRIEFDVSGNYKKKRESGTETKYNSHKLDEFFRTQLKLNLKVGRYISNISISYILFFSLIRLIRLKVYKIRKNLKINIFDCMLLQKKKSIKYILFNFGLFFFPISSTFSSLKQELFSKNFSINAYRHMIKCDQKKKYNLSSSNPSSSTHTHKRTKKNAASSTK